jgi:hypothetical protein
MKRYTSFDDDLLSVGWAIAGFIAVLLVLLGFVVMELV